MKKSLCALSLGLGLLSSAITVKPAQAVSLKLLPAVQTVSVGDSVGIDIEISELGNLRSPSLSGFDFSLSFDPNILIFKSLNFGDPIQGDLVGLTNLTRFTDIQTSLGLVNFSEVSLDDPADLNAAQPDSFILARANFTANKAGSSPLTILINNLSDENTNSLSLTSELTNASVTVKSNSTSVPEPNVNFWGLALTIGFGAVLKKKKIKPQVSNLSQD